MSIEENVKNIKEQMRQAAISAGRDPDSVLLWCGLLWSEGS